ncbi:MAG: heavy metal translocating P-type ATPase, partial [Bacteroidota bacterium]
TLHFCCYGCSFTHSLTGEQGEAGTAGLFLARLGFSAFLSMNIMAISWMIYDQGWTTFGLEPETVPYLEKLLFVLSIPIMLFVGWPYIRNGWNELQSLRFSMDGLIALGTFTAFGFSSVQTFSGGGDVYFDTATMTLVLVTAGRYIEATAKVRTSDAIRKLIDLQPDTSRVIRSGIEILVPSSDVAVGESIKVLPGERVPLDGVLEGGMTTVNESILSGESIPVVKRAADSMFAATINIDGTIIVKVMARQTESLHSRIVQLMDEAQRSRSPIQQTVDKIAGIFIPVVIGIALLTLVGWLLVGPFELALIHALTVLVVACPCALGIGAPLASAIGIGHAAENGVLVRSTAVLERAAATRGVAFDKTGTLTKGELSVRSVHATGNEGAMVRIAASLERDSEHVLSKAIVRHAREKNLTLFESRDVRAVPGLGLGGNVLVDGSWIGVFVGTGELMEREGLEMGDAPRVAEPTDATRVFVGWGGLVRGSLELTDTLRRNAKEVIDELGAMSIQTWMLSGDSEGVTRRIGDALGIAEAFGRLLPADKLEMIRRLRSSGGLMMVGDGINDAPSLAAADVGVTLGSATDIAKESADVTIIGDHLEKIPWLIQFSRRVLSTIRWNLVWAFGYNAVGMAFAIAGLLEPILAAVAMVLSSLFIIVNSRRLIRD